MDNAVSIGNKFFHFVLSFDPFLLGLGCDVSDCASCDLVLENVCYQYFDQNKQWTDANSSCIAWGGELVSLSSQQQLNTVSILQENGYAWTSLTNLRSQSGALSWADMSPLALTQENSSVNTVCGYINTADNTTLELGDCSVLRPFVCSKAGNQLLMISLIMLSSHKFV